MWLLAIALHISSSYAQLSSPDEAVCIGEQVVWVCNQTGASLRWIVNLPGDDVGNVLTSGLIRSSRGMVVATFFNDPYGFEIHVLSTSSTNRIVSKLNVSAKRELNGVRVDCVTSNTTFTSILQILTVTAPPAPSGVMTTADQSQFTPSTASITLTWSASSGADSYTIMVTPLLPSGQSLLSTTTTSLQLTVLYNKQYSINITAHNCVGSNSTIVSLMSVGCSPPSPLANGSISEYSSGAVGAMLTFQCDTGYMPQEEVSSTCLSNSSWAPTPECHLVDCGIPLNALGDVVGHPNITTFGALITYHCEGSNTSANAICESNRQWYPDPASLCLTPTTDSVTMGKIDTLSRRYHIIITAVVCSLSFLLLGMFLGVLIHMHHCIVRHKDKRIKLGGPIPPPATVPALYEEVSPDSNTKRRNDIELRENVAYGPVAKVNEM